MASPRLPSLPPHSPFGNLLVVAALFAASSPTASGSGGGLWPHQTNPCVYEDHLLTDKNWFGYLANITIMTTGRLTFEFHYPADKCCQNILFYSEDQLSILNARMNCWQKEYLLRPEEDQILRLTPRFSWSGCHMTHPNDVPTYVCKGGRSFTVEQAGERPITWYIAASNCATLEGLDLRYRMEVFGHIGDCRNAGTVGTYKYPNFGSTGGEFPPPVHGPWDLSASNRPSRPDAAHAARGEAAHPSRSEVVEENEEGGTREMLEAAVGQGGQGGQGGKICVIEGDVNSTQSWFGFLANISLTAGGGFSFKITLPHSMQPLNLILYSPEDVVKLTPDKTCWQRDGVIRSPQLPDQVIDINVRASWSGCTSKNYSAARSLVCQGVRRYDRARRIHFAVSNCRSTAGLQLHYRFEVVGYDNDICGNGAGEGLRRRDGGVWGGGIRTALGAVMAVVVGSRR